MHQRFLSLKMSALNLTNPLCCQGLIGFLLTFQAKFYIPDAAIDILIKFLNGFFNVLSRFSPFMELVAKAFFVMQKKVGWSETFNKLLCAQNVIQFIRTKTV